MCTVKMQNFLSAQGKLEIFKEIFKSDQFCIFFGKCVRCGVNPTGYGQNIKINPTG